MDPATASASPLYFFLFWTYAAGAFVCLGLLGRIGFDLLQGSRPCTPAVDRLVLCLVGIGVGFAVNPALGLTPSVGGVIVVVFVDALLWVLGGGTFMLVRRPGMLNRNKPGGLTASA